MTYHNILGFLIGIEFGSIGIVLLAMIWDRIETMRIAASVLIVSVILSLFLLILHLGNSI